MKKLSEIPQASLGDGDFPLDDHDDKRELIARLEGQGHKTICVGRAVVTIEQCERGDEYPKGWVEDPLRLRVYPDPCCGGEEPDEIYVHAHRMGVMEVFLKRGAKNDPACRLVPIEAASVERASGFNPIIGVKAIQKLVDERMSGYYYQWRSDPASGRPFGGYPQHDEELARLAQDVKEAMARYLAKLRSLPHVEPPPSYDGGA